VTINQHLSYEFSSFYETCEKDIKGKTMAQWINLLLYKKTDGECLCCEKKTRVEAVVLSGLTAGRLADEIKLHTRGNIIFLLCLKRYSFNIAILICFWVKLILR